MFFNIMHDDSLSLKKKVNLSYGLRTSCAILALKNYVKKFDEAMQQKVSVFLGRLVTPVPHSLLPLKVNKGMKRHKGGHNKTWHA